MMENSQRFDYPHFTYSIHVTDEGGGGDDVEVGVSSAELKLVR